LPAPLLKVSLLVVYVYVTLKKIREWPVTATITIDTPPDFIDMGEYSNSCDGVNKNCGRFAGICGVQNFVYSPASKHQRVTF